ncbi:DUF4457-containing protein [Aureococcus anophagefferens]|nr:DUF4457-containing protein [Aureococcus anophagefferens]
MMMQVPVDGPPSPKTAAHMEYLRRLEEATKLKKPRKSAKPVRLAKKEAGFDLHWAGANRQRTGGKLKKAARPLAALAPPENARRTWGRTARRPPPPTKSDDEYDDDFDESGDEPAAASGGWVLDAAPPSPEVFARTVVTVQAGAKAADDDVVEATPEAAPVEAPPGPPSRRGSRRAARRDVVLAVLAAVEAAPATTTPPPRSALAAVAAGLEAPAEAVVEEAPAEAAAEAVVEAVVEVPPAIAPPAIAPPAIAPPAIAPPAIAPPAIAPRAEPFVATVRIRNGWGNARIAGLDGLALVGGDGAVIEVAPTRSGSRRVAAAARAGVEPAIGGVADEPGALGARSIEVEVDGALVFAGELPRRARDAKGSGWFDVALTAPAAVPAELAAAAPTPAAEAAPTPAEEAPPALKPAPSRRPGDDGRGGRRALFVEEPVAARAGASALGDSFADSVAGAPGDADSFVEDDDDEVFEGVPTLPSGRVLTVQILSTWGDPHYVGLHGLELFDDRGAPVAPVAIAATPSMEGHDPRTPENLCDGVYDTSDELRAWLCPFDAAEPPTVTLELAPASQPPTTLAMLRLWNYNASRTASTRGARFLRCFLDGVKIFEGEAEKDEEDEALDRLLEVARPSTADRLEDSVADEAPVVARDAGERPAGAGVVCRRLRLRLAATWGDAHWVGLTGLRVLGERGPVELDFSKIAATPRDLKSLGHAGDPRTLDKLFDGCHATRDDAHMWLVPFDGATKPVVDVDLGAPTRVFGLEVHNYNKSPEDALRGARTLVVEADGAPLRTVELRPAPGRAVDFGQLVSFDEPPAKPPGPLRVRPPVRGAVLADYETPLLPRGSLLRFVIHSSWGDPYYVGLDGIRLVGEDGREIPWARRVDAVPRSVRVLGAGFADDARLPANLFSGSAAVLKRADEVAPGEAQHVLFTHDRHDRRPANVEPQDVLCIDENQVRVRSKAMFEPDRALGKFETVDLAARPATSVVR